MARSQKKGPFVNEKLFRKVMNLKATGADWIVTSCPACIIQLSYGVRKHGLKTRVCHISEVIRDCDS